MPPIPVNPEEPSRQPALFRFCKFSGVFSGHPCRLQPTFLAPRVARSIPYFYGLFPTAVPPHHRRNSAGQRSAREIWSSRAATSRYYSGRTRRPQPGHHDLEIFRITGYSRSLPLHTTPVAGKRPEIICHSKRPDLGRQISGLRPADRPRFRPWTNVHSRDLIAGYLSNSKSVAHNSHHRWV